jgi:hypothetical protein|tara:strand:+ start:369 stop:875 length:507 start_codon:yes stop_codon:yes gene_type:complete
MIENIFDTPVPGQSLTNTPGNYPWEHPPQYTNIEQASEYVWDILHKEKNLDQVITFLKNGIPVEAIARTMLFGGFMEGKWSVDTALLIAEVVFKQIMAIGVRANVQNIVLFIKDQGNDKFHRQFAEFKNMKSAKQTAKAPEDRLKTFVKDVKEELKEKEMGLMSKEDK